MPETFQSHQIASGENNVAGLVNIETIAVDGVYFVTVDDIGKFNFGQDVLYGNQVGGVQGFQSTKWVSGHITLAQYHYIYTTLLGGSTSARVTISTRSTQSSTYANYSATLTIPSPDKLNKTNTGHFTDFVWSFTALEVIP